MRERSSRPGRLYAAIPNEAMRDKSLSIEARGLLALLMTYSDDWVFIKEHLQDITGMGRDKFERTMGELVKSGYVERVLTREEETGKLLGSTWIIRDDRGPENQGVGVTEALKNRPPAEPTPGKSAPKNNKREEEQFERKPEGVSKQDSVLEALCQRLRPDTAADFIAHRKAMKKPLTARAAELIIAKLENCRDPDAVVNNSIMNGWQGVFPEREPPRSTSQGDFWTGKVLS